MSEPSVKPTRGWFLAKRGLAPKETPSGIIIPESAQRRANSTQVGVKQSVVVVAMHPTDEFDVEYSTGPGPEYADIETQVPGWRGFHVGDEVFVLAQDDNLIPVVTDFYGRVEVNAGVQVPEWYLFKCDAVAGVLVAAKTEETSSNG